MNALLLFWIFLGLVFLILEAATPGIFFFFSGFIGSLASIIIHILGFEFELQAFFFFLAFIISILILKHATKKLSIFKTQHHQKSNMYALIGKRAIVTHAIKPPSRGYVKINGELWQAESIKGDQISLNEEVEIVRVDGAHVKVKKV